MTVADIPLDKIDARGDDIQVREQLSGDTVRAYAESINYLPPVDVFNIVRTDDDGDEVVASVLVDGFHRYAAYKLADRETIPCNVHSGTLLEAQQFAIIANATSGRPLSPQEKHNAIVKLHRLFPSLTQKEIGERMSTSQPHVQRTLKVAKMRATTDLGDMPDATVYEAAKLPNKSAIAVLDYASRNGLTRADVRKAVRVMETADAETKRAMLASDKRPPTVRETKEGLKIIPARESEDSGEIVTPTAVGLEAALAIIIETPTADLASADMLMLALESLTEAVEHRLKGDESPEAMDDASEIDQSD